MTKNTQTKKRYIDIEQIDQQCMNMSINLKEDYLLIFKKEDEVEDYTTQAKTGQTPISGSKFRNNSVISSLNNNTFLSSEMYS